MVSIIVPTYCEAQNIPALVRALSKEMAIADLEYEILIVDDNSPDDTLEVVAELEQDFPVRILQPGGRERDLSLSVVDGIREAKADSVVVMDADLSHPVEVVPVMVRQLKQDDSRFVLGSRYMEGGSFDRDWSLWRFLNSYIATLMARPLTSSNDPMSGFFAFDKRRVVVSKLRPIGYKIGLELMVKGEFTGVTEVAIQFKDRTVGESKMNFAQQWKYIKHLRRLYLHRFKGWAEFVHYAVVGASGFVVDVSFYYLLQLAGLDHQLARAISFWPAVSWNWALNRITTFGERQRRPRAKQWVEFVMTSLFGFSINWGVYFLLTTYISLFESYRLLALVAGIVVASLFNFTASTLFVYNEKRD
jgi:dolichol-phosphate mannosyltransferase